jgi:hypothetical protein
MWSKRKAWFIRTFYSDVRVQKNYVEAGRIFGDALSYSYLGTPVGYDEMLERWAEWEFEYARRGYRTLFLDDFIDAGGYGTSIADKLGVKCGPEEKPIPHSLIYMEQHARPPPPAVDLAALMQPGAQSQMGTYTLPSTEQIRPPGYREKQ